MFLFTPPGRVERRGEHPVFGRLPLTRGVSLLRASGIYTQVEDPAAEAVEAAEAAYLGGHVYEVTDEEAASLTAAGYGDWLRSAGYGSGLYGAGPYGGD